MRLSLKNTGKRFNREWIFRHINYTFEQGGKYAITGPNGSGKSTLLQVISGAVTHSEGTIQYNLNGTTIKSNEEYKHVAIAAPYLELIEEMTANEFLSFHTTFKPLNTAAEKILQIIGLEKAANKQIRYYSSGMKQRLKLAQAFFADTAMLLLDEPTTNLDAEGIQLYHQLITDHTKNRMVIVSSNDKQEYDFCTEIIRINDYKS